MSAAIERERRKRHHLNHLIIEDERDHEHEARVRIRAHEERQLKRVYRKKPLAPVAALLLTRAQTAQALACSVSTIIRMEDDGLLRPVKLNRSATGKTYYSVEQVAELAKSGVR